MRLRQLVPGLTAAFAATAAASAPFNPVEFFNGRTHGEGELKIIVQSPEDT